jgi:hypothetical protein
LDPWILGSLDPWILGSLDPQELSREDLLALLAESRASEEAKDARIDALLVTVGELAAQVHALVLKLGKDSQSSSKPPSSDGPDRRPRGGSSRTSSGRRPGNGSVSLIRPHRVTVGQSNGRHPPGSSPDRHRRPAQTAATPSPTASCALSTGSTPGPGPHRQPHHRPQCPGRACPDSDETVRRPLGHDPQVHHRSDHQIYEQCC